MPPESPLHSSLAAKKQQSADLAQVPDNALVSAITAGDKGLYGILMQRYNQRVYRLVRAIVGSDDEAEDVVQHAYVRAYAKLGSFRHQASFATWLTRIAINEALERVRRRSRRSLVALTESEAPDETSQTSATMTPEEQAYRHQVARLLEWHIDRLPENLRVVFMMREVEELSTLETAELLSISAEAVRVRLHRARQILQENMSAATALAADVFHFAGERCARIVARVSKSLDL